MKAIKCYFISLNSILLLFGLCSIIAGVVAVGGFTMDEWPKELNDMLENEYIKIKKTSNSLQNHEISVKLALDFHNFDKNLDFELGRRRASR